MTSKHEASTFDISKFEVNTVSHEIFLKLLLLWMPIIVSDAHIDVHLFGQLAERESFIANLKFQSNTKYGPSFFINSIFFCPLQSNNNS
jgi:hypothetical protein